MNIKTSHEQPAIYDILNKFFGVEWDDGVIITYGDTVYSKYPISPIKQAHEAVHVKQQTSYNPSDEQMPPNGTREDSSQELWWRKYLADKKFRLDQEVEAYRAEWQYIKENVKGREYRRILVNEMARHLSSFIYGNLVTYKQALKLIKE